MALFRTLSAPEPLPPIVGEGVVLRAAADGGSRRLGGVARGEPQVSDAVGADLAGRRSDAPGVSPAAAPLRRGHADRSGLSRSSCSAPRTTRWSAVWRSPTSAAASPRPAASVTGLATPYIRRGYMTAAVRALDPGGVRRAAAAPRRGGLHSDQCRLGAAPGENRLPARGLCALLSVHQRKWQDHLLYARLQTDPRD